MKNGWSRTNIVEQTQQNKFHKENGEYGNVEDALQSSEDAVISASEVDEEVSSFPLERCMRIVPHDQNGGAFFIAVFHKRSDLPGAFKYLPSHWIFLKNWSALR